LEWVTAQFLIRMARQRFQAMLPVSTQNV